MNKKIYTIILASIFICFQFANNHCVAQNVYIPDVNFKAALIGNSKINTNADTAIQVSEALALNDSINVSSLSIYDLTGIEAFTSLKRLNCSSNYLHYLDVSSNSVLTYLNCADNYLDSLKISKNKALTYLNCKGSYLGVLDVSTNTALTYLNCNSSYLSALNVSSNKLLTTLSCDYNQITELNISSNTLLTKLICSSNQLDTLNLSSNTLLTYLDCNDNEIDSLNLSKNTGLTYLNCGDNKLSNLDISTNTALITLFCDDNKLATLDVSANKILDKLICSYNDLSSLDVSKNTILDYLNCRSNKLTSINLVGASALTVLMCSSNELKKINVTTNSALTDLLCDYNELDSLNLVGNKLLVELDCAVNELKELDVSVNTALTYLFCDVNKITALNLSTDTALTDLYCTNNDLVYLNVQNGRNKQLFLDALNNPNLTCIQVDSVAYSNAKWTYKDTIASFSTNCGPSSIITTQTSATCNKNNGTVTIGKVTGGVAPYQYNFNNLGYSTNTTYSGLDSGTYSLLVKDYFSSIFIANPIKITRTIPKAPAICVVTVDTNSTHNIIVWEKTVTTAIDSFRIYREDVSNVYTYLASVDYDSLSIYEDYAINPNTTGKRYKITLIDSCSAESEESQYHNTIWLNYLGNGILSWTNYQIEGQANVVSQYEIYRDSLGIGNWKLIGTTAGTQTGWTDINYATYPNARYRVVVTFGYSCTPTKSLNTLKVRSTSNQSGNNIINVALRETSNHSNFTIYPNPSDGEFTISVEGKVQNAKLNILDLMGKEVFTATLNINSVEGSAVQNSSFNIQHLAKGVYFVKVDNAVKKLVVE